MQYSPNADLLTFGKQYHSYVACFEFPLLIFVRSPYIPCATPPHPNPTFEFRSPRVSHSTLVVEVND